MAKALTTITASFPDWEAWEQLGYAITALRYNKRLAITLTWLASYLQTEVDKTVVRYADSTKS